MRILWSSNSPFAPTGYGQQTASAVANLHKMGHKMAVFAFWGLQGGKVDWGEIPIYPNPEQDFGVKKALPYYQDWEADILITLIDAWVLAGMDSRLNWVPWLPVDHDPAPDIVVDAMKNNPGLVMALVQSRWGQERLKERGMDSVYVPNDYDTEVYAPNAEARTGGRERYGWQDKFVVGMVATNHSERKNWNVAMRAVAEWEKLHPGKVIFYCHTNPVDPRGINLLALREHLGIQHFSFFPSQTQMEIGIDRETLARTYNVMDLFLLPSKGEGACRPIVEAQACGVPVLTTRCTSHQEFVHPEAGFWIDRLRPHWTLQAANQYDCDVDEVVERLEETWKAKENGSLMERGQASRQFAEQFSDARVYPEYWKPVLEMIEAKIKQPRNGEGVQPWRLALIPQTCAPRKVLDLGCGVTAPYRETLKRLGEYVGVDVRKGESDDIVVADAHNLPFEDKEFGFVWCSEMLEHCKDPRRVVEEAKRVGRHGVILFSTPTNPFFKSDPDHRPVKVPYTQTATGDGMIAW